MDAIFGIWHLDGTSATASELEQMAAALESLPGHARAVTVICDGTVGMGRLTIGRGATRQPPTQDGGLLCVADARLYRAPESQAPQNMTAADRERLFCRLHARLGDDAPLQVEGDFAYAVWDRGRQRLTLARDHAGVRPMFYRLVPGRSLVWATHSDLIARSGLGPVEVNLEAAVGNLIDNSMGAEDTVLRGLRRLPPAHVLHMVSGGVERMHRYWSLRCRNPIPAAADFDACATELRRLLDQAVRCRLPPHRGVGAHLSGGLDSSALSVLAARALGEQGRQLHTYSFVSDIRPDVHFLDERPYVAAVVDSEPNIRNTKVTPAVDEGYIAGSAADRVVGYTGAEAAVLEAAVRDGADVILSGWGGDEAATFNGRGAYAEHFLRGRWRLLRRELRARSRLYHMPQRRVFLHEVLLYILPERLQRLLRRAAGRAPAAVPTDRTFLRPPYRDLQFGTVTLTASTHHNRRALFGHENLAFRLESWAMQGAHHGVHFTFPMLDRALLDYCIRLPARMFLRDGVRRAIFRGAMRGVLPDIVRNRRPKLVPFPCAILRLSERRADLLDEVARLRADPRITRVLDLDAVEAALRALPAPDIVQRALNAEADGGAATATEPTALFDVIAFARNLKDRLGD